MPEPELTVRDLTPPVLACDSGRHPNHPGETCEEFEELQAGFIAFVSDCLLNGSAETERRLIEGSGMGEPHAKRLTAWYAVSAEEMADYGVTAAEPEPTPVERALAILDPELRRCPLYNGGLAALYPEDRKA